MVSTQSYRRSEVVTPIFINTKLDLTAVKILGYHNPYCSNTMPEHYKAIATPNNKIPYVGSHNSPKYIFIGCVLIPTKHHSYNVLSIKEFNELYEVA